MSTVQDVLDQMLEEFRGRWGGFAQPSILMSSHVWSDLAGTSATRTAGIRVRDVRPTGWYREVPVDAVAYQQRWLLAVIGSRAGGGDSPTLFGDVRTGRISTAMPEVDEKPRT